MAATLACYTHHLLIISLAAQAMFVLLFFLRSARLTGSGTGPIRGASCGAVRGAGFAAVGAFLTIAILYAPWLPRLWRQSESVRSSWVRTLQANDAAHQVYAALLGTPASRAAEPVAVAWGAVGLLLAAHLVLVGWFGWAGVFLAMCGLLPVVFLLGYSATSLRSIFDCRYLVFPQTFWLVTGALIASSVRHMPERWLAAIALVGCSGFGLWDSWDVLGSTSRPGVRDAVRFVLESRRPGEPVCVLSPLLFFTTAYYMRHESDHPWYVASSAQRKGLRGWTHLRDDEIVTVKQLSDAHWRSVWLISNSPLDLDSLGLPSAEGTATARRWSFNPELHNRWESSIIVVHHQRSN